jgi:ParB family chromosome partitioning protein
VRPIEKGLEIVAGHRRFMACRSLRWRYVPCRIKDLSDKEAFEIQLVENIQRNALDPVEEAEAFSKYVLDYGWGGVTELARRIGKSEEYVSHRLQILRLPSEVKDEISRRRLSVSHAMEIASLEPVQQKKVADAIIENRLSVQAVRELKKFAKEGDRLEEFLQQTEGQDRTITSNVKRLRVLKKTLLSLKLTLFRLDSIIEEVNNSFEPSDRVTVLNVLMGVRLKVHNLIDDVIRARQDIKRSDL